MTNCGGIARNRNMSSGQRCLDRTPLTEKEIEWLKEEIRAIDADESIFIFNDEDHILKSTCYDFVEDVVYVTKNVFPDTKSDSTHPRDKMSPRAVLAHEYYGHRPQRARYLKEMSKEIKKMDIWEDERNASLDAAFNAPNLNNVDRALLIEDAEKRSLEAGHVFNYDNKRRYYMGMPNCQDSQTSQKKRLSRTLANKAEEEMMRTGVVTVRCPECNEHPVVDRDSHRVFVQCSCGFIRKGELLEI